MVLFFQLLFLFSHFNQFVNFLTTIEEVCRLGLEI
jgi:hypothetical protein